MLKVVTTHAKLEKKIYDGSTKANFTEDSEVFLQDYIGGDDIKINIKKIKLNFEDGVIGLSKRVEMDPTNALEGVAAGNYYLEKSYIKNEAIYPYSVSAYVEGFGEIVLYNDRGLLDNTKADLIPIGAVLKVEAIKPDTAEYVDLYGSISKYISRTKVFVVGYKLTLEVDSIAQPISNELYLSIPKVEDVENVIFVSNENTGELKYEVRENSIEIDLSSTNFELETIAITQHEALLALWQIVLIITGSVVIVGGVVTSIVIITIKRKRKNEMLEKI